MPRCHTQEELLDVIYWQRQLVALAAGVAWGVLPLTGLWAFLGYPCRLLATHTFTKLQP